MRGAVFVASVLRRGSAELQGRGTQWRVETRVVYGVAIAFVFSRAFL